MSTNIKQVQVSHGRTWGSSVVAYIRDHPLGGYFLLTYGLAWLWEIPMFGIWHQWFPGPWLILSPTLAAFLMAWITEGRAGIGQLLRRCLAWRAGVQWYLIAVLSIPALFIVTLILMPDGFTAFQVPTLGFLFTYLMAFLSKFFAAPFTEQPGWRGFAQPRLQERYGPLVGTLILGLLWGLWHLPFWLLLPGHSGAGSGLLGIGVPFMEWLAFIVGFTILIAWVFNHTRGSVLLAMLFHASINSTVETFPGTLFPALFPPVLAAHAGIPLWTEMGMLMVGILIIIVTRGRLGYDQYQRETSSTSS
jgi:membrane protease YdiL (CAAX protease family)